jgi:hypothetical protein
MELKRIEQPCHTVNCTHLILAFSSVPVYYKYNQIVNLPENKGSIISEF